MSLPTSMNTSIEQPSKNIWPSIAPYAIPCIAAGGSIVPIFRDMILKSAQQKGQAIPFLTLRESWKEGVKAAPTVGAIVGTQMAIQSVVKKKLIGESKEESLSSNLVSSAVVGAGSAPVLAVFNGQTMGWTIRESLRRFSARQGMAIAVQETGFVGGLSIVDKLAALMRKKFGNYKAIDYIAAFLAGAGGSLVGHPANTALTRWQSGMAIDSIYQLMWGSIRKAYGIGKFSLYYKLGKEALNYITPDSK